MTPVTMKYTETLDVVHCWCGIAVGIPSTLNRSLHQSSKNEAYCPLGHRFGYGDSFQEKLEAEQRRHKATKELLAAEERSHAGTRGALTKVKKRIHAGVCPHCNRSFADVGRHMKSKHAEELAHD